MEQGDARMPVDAVSSNGRLLFFSGARIQEDVSLVPRLDEVEHLRDRIGDAIERTLTRCWIGVGFALAGLLFVAE
jgi:hypothetical protein